MGSVRCGNAETQNIASLPSPPRYIPIIDELMVFDNSEARTELIAVKAKGAEIIVLNSVKFTQLKKHSHANA